MADILIRGVEMPKEGEKILISAGGSVWVNAWPTRGYMRMEDVYAVPLPAGHGKIVDAEEIRTRLIRKLTACKPGTIEELTFAVSIDIVDHADTIVPAEGSTSE